MAAHTELKNKIAKDSGAAMFKERFTVRQWVQWLKGNQDARVQNIGWALDYGVRTGRLPNVNANDELMRNGHTLTNLQMATLIAKAAISQETNDTAAGLKALQKELNIRVV